MFYLKSFGVTKKLIRNRNARMPSIDAKAIHWNEILSMKNNHVKAIVPLAFAAKDGIIKGRNLIGDVEMIM